MCGPTHELPGLSPSLATCPNGIVTLPHLSGPQFIRTHIQSKPTVVATHDHTKPRTHTYSHAPAPSIVRVSAYANHGVLTMPSPVPRPPPFPSPHRPSPHPPLTTPLPAPYVLFTLQYANHKFASNVVTLIILLFCVSLLCLARAFSLAYNFTLQRHFILWLGSLQLVVILAIAVSLRLAVIYKWKRSTSAVLARIFIFTDFFLIR